MQINISARHGHLSAGTQEKVTEKVERIRKFYDRVTSIRVTADLEHRDRPSVEIVVTAERHDEFVSTDAGDSVLSALDGAIHKVEMQLRKHKERTTEHKGVGGKHVGNNENAE